SNLISLATSGKKDATKRYRLNATKGSKCRSSFLLNLFRFETKRETYKYRKAPCNMKSEMKLAESI
ncbi:MAG TPA: hypothetical protein VJY12_10715, partial [Dysgonamonadaceae bacterium]|nr:hypothetical protein [Dysgonamonadaceae bacterium]